MKIFITSALLLLTAMPAYAAENLFSDTAKYEKPFTLSYEDAEKTISDALINKGVGSKVTASITGAKDAPLYAAGQPLSVEVRGLTFDAQDHRWSANLLMMADGQVVTAMPVAGKYEEILEVPVLRRMVRSGDVIGLGDVEIRDFPLMHTRPDTITDLATLIGKSPLRSISPQRPIRLHEIVEPTVVKKNSVVQMRYALPGMEISATGQAVDDGAVGEIINVRNTDSHKLVRAIVQDEHTVSILVPGASPTQTTQLTEAQNDAATN
jgi:flagella basal body P-ring formation protein FlgA